MLLTNLSTGTVCHEFIDPELDQGHERIIAGVHFHPQGGILASVDNQRLKLWEVASGAALLASVIVGPAERGAVSFTAAGRHLVVTGEREDSAL